jgi:hypothetical protein
MADYVIQTLAEFQAAPNDFTNAVFAFDVPDNGEVTGLTGGVLYIARRIRFSTETTFQVAFIEQTIAEGSFLVPVTWTGTLDRLLVTGTTFNGDYRQFEEGAGVPLDFAEVSSRVAAILANNLAVGAQQADVGDTLDAGSYMAVYDAGQAAPTLTVEWVRGDVFADPAIATGQTYVPVAADEGLDLGTRHIFTQGGATRTKYGNFYSVRLMPPVLSLPVDEAAPPTGATGSVSTDIGEGVLYWVASTSATPPDTSRVKGGQDMAGLAAASGSQAVTATGVQVLSPAPAGLAEGTFHVIHFMHEARGRRSPVVSADGFMTDGTTPVVPSAFADLDWSVNTGSSGALLNVTIATLPDDGGPPITRVEYDVNQSGTWQFLRGSNPGTTSIVMPAANTSYTIRVRAVNDLGAGPASTTKTGTSGEPA